MNIFYLRWGVILVLGLIVASQGIQRYYRDVATLSPSELILQKPDKTVRVRGTVIGGSLMRKDSQNDLSFLIEGQGKEIPVHFIGSQAEGLRELKTIVVEGRWDPSSGELKGEKIGIIPNYGFVSAAYLLGFIPIILFLFHTEWKVRLLYSQIKETKVYESEEMGFDTK